jgi:hypothetical protein
MRPSALPVLGLSFFPIMQTNLGTYDNTDANRSNNPSLSIVYSIEEGESTHTEDIGIDNVPSPHCRGTPNVN